MEGILLGLHARAPGYMAKGLGIYCLRVQGVRVSGFRVLGVKDPNITPIYHIVVDTRFHVLFHYPYYTQSYPNIRV